MKMLLSRQYLTLLTLLAIPTGTLARGGPHGSSSNSDSDSDSSSSSGGGSSSSSSSSSSSNSDDTTTSSSTGSSSNTCTDTHHLSYTDLQPYHYNQYNLDPRAGHASAYSVFDGIYLKGAGTLTYTLTTPAPNITALGTPSTNVLSCPSETQSLRLLGAAWVAGRPPRPAGPTNPIAIGFKAWQSGMAVSDIDYSYSVCQNVDVLRFGTTVDLMGGSMDYDTVQAMDAVQLSISQSPEDADTILFEGVYDLINWAGSARDKQEPERFDDAGLWDQMLYLPAKTCEQGGRGLGRVLVGWNGTRVSGSLSNRTLSLNLRGEVSAGFERVGGSYVGSESDGPGRVNVSFEVVFEGTLDEANSTQVVLTGAASRNESLVTFERASAGVGMRVSLFLLGMSGLMCFVMIL